jgi:hypothetical protein
MQSVSAAKSVPSKHHLFVEFKVLMAVTMQITIFWDTATVEW